jgi:hypothetical protein
VAVAGCVVAVLAELLGAAAGHPIGAGAVVVHGAAVAAGALAAHRWLPGLTRHFRGRQRPLLLAATYSGLVLLWAWRPFLPETSLERFLGQFFLDALIPLRALGMRFDVFSVVDPLQQFCLLFPLGALLAVWPLRRTGPLAGPIPGVLLALMAEGGQLFVAGRFVDSTDALVGIAAALIGWVLVRRSGFAAYGEMLGQGRRGEPRTG